MKEEIDFEVVIVIFISAAILLNAIIRGLPWPERWALILFRGDEHFGSSFKPRPIEKAYLRELQAHFIYYQNFNPRNKRRVENRVQAFIDANEFIPRSYTHVNAEMKALIAASAVQLTFGYEHLNFEHFNKILIYQDDYYSKITRKYHQGEVNMRGLIVIS